jgi:hypothetical protein
MPRTLVAKTPFRIQFFEEKYMAETTKKANAPVKPKKTANKKTTIHEVEKPVAHEQIEQLARQYWAERGWQDGYAEQDWLRAEQELRQKAS